VAKMKGSLRPNWRLSNLALLRPNWRNRHGRTEHSLTRLCCGQIREVVEAESETLQLHFVIAKLKRSAL